VNEMIITELSHRRRHGCTSRLVKPRPGDRLDADRVAVFMAQWSYTKRYITHALTPVYGGKPVALANSDPIAAATPTALTDAGAVPRVAVSPRPQTPRSHAVSRRSTRRCGCATPSPSQADARALTSSTERINVCMMRCKLHALPRRGG
jgi:hypothetical protein